MRKFWSMALVVGGLLAFVLQASAEWRVYRKAEVVSPERHVLRIDRWEAKPAYAWFILKWKAPGRFDKWLPLYQVDENPVREVATFEKRATDRNKNRWIRWEVVDRKGKISEALREMMDGSSVVFQYYLEDGTIKETTFSLKGAKEAIEQVLE